MNNNKEVVLDSYDMKTAPCGLDNSFILEYPKMFDPGWCADIIKRYHDLETKGMTDISDAGADRTLHGQSKRAKGSHVWLNHISQIDMTAAVHLDPLCRFFFDTLATAVKIYKTKYREGFWMPLSCNDMKVQRVRAGGGFHAWHSEWSKENSARQLVYQVYLNDLPDGEGETEFIYQGVRCKPEVGKLIIWPAGWTHTHRGNPNYSEDKYVVTGWIHNNDINLYNQIE